MTAGKDGAQLKWKWTPSAAHNIKCKKNGKMHTGNVIVNVCETNDCFMLFFLNARLTRNVTLRCSLKPEILRFLEHATYIQQQSDNSLNPNDILLIMHSTHVHFNFFFLFQLCAFRFRFFSRLLLNCFVFLVPVHFTMVSQLCFYFCFT